METDRALEFELPFPPSTNHYYRNFHGRAIISKEGRAYRERVREALRYHPAHDLSGRLSVHVTIHPPDRRRRDLDNCGKALLDSLQHAGVYLDDSQIDDLRITRGNIRVGGAAVVTIREMGVRGRENFSDGRVR